MGSVEDFQRTCFTDGGTHREGELVLDISVRRLGTLVLPSGRLVR